jgi:hypothetical protein
MATLRGRASGHDRGECDEREPSTDGACDTCRERHERE